MTDEPVKEGQKSGGTWKLVLFLVVVGGGLAAFFLLGGQTLLNDFLQWVKQLGLAGNALFALLYVCACVFFISGALLTLGAGALWGLGCSPSMVAADLRGGEPPTRGAPSASAPNSRVPGLLLSRM